jgi:uncharacterized protein YyaL (SSP411 family)
MHAIPKPNRLINEKSPYLLQHAHNPVEWYPWGEEAFTKAREENKPIFLSIGYSTCYWCHVMEREVFENENIAAQMNKHLVAIKIDREERPDIDRIYMSAVQAMAGSGGWPMSVFLDNDLQPFWGGTYIPPTTAHGRAGFPDLLLRIVDVWKNSKEKVLDVSNSLTEYLRKISSGELSTEIVGKEIFEKTFQSIARTYDETYGGFGIAPKFPRPVQFNFLLRHYYRTGNTLPLEMTLHTLRAMWRGGMYDHLGGGFHRYSTDELWRIPHFEKMLYDQALLVNSYLEAYQITHDEFFADVARDVLTYVEHNLLDKDGGFYSAEDAESLQSGDSAKKEEGELYLWKKSAIEKLLEEDAELFCFYFGIAKEGNALYDPQKIFVEKNVLCIAHTIEETAEYFGTTTERTEKILMNSCKILFEAREEKPKPHRDEKILVSWNALMISAFAKASRILQNEYYAKIAERAIRFILETLYEKETKLLFRRYCAGEKKYAATLEDYAFFIQSLLDTYEATFNENYIKSAHELTVQQIENFYDANNGGFFDTTAEETTLLLRTKECYDGAEPSGNAIAIFNLLRCSQLFNKKEWKELAEQSLKYFNKKMNETHGAMVQFLVALDFYLHTPKEIIIVGEKESPQTRDMLEEIFAHFLPEKIIVFHDGKDGQKYFSSQNDFYKNISLQKESTTVYVCADFACELPVTERKFLATLLEKK